MKVSIQNPKSKMKTGYVKTLIFGVATLTGTCYLAVQHNIQVHTENLSGRQATAHLTTKSCGCASYNTSGAEMINYIRTADDKVQLQVPQKDAAKDTPSNGDQVIGHIIIPKDAGFYALIVSPNERIPLATTSPLPYDSSKHGGQWSAAFGTMAHNGSYYIAPKTIPYAGLDWIRYVSADGSHPDITLAVSVQGTPAQNAAAGGNVTCLGKTGVPLLNLKEGMMKDNTSETGYYHVLKILASETDSSSNIHLASDIANTSQIGALGYLLPSHSGRAFAPVFLYEPATSITANEVPVICRKPGPINAYPPFPPGQSSYNCTPGGPYNVPATTLLNWSIGGRTSDGTIQTLGTYSANSSTVVNAYGAIEDIFGKLTADDSLKYSGSITYQSYNWTRTAYQDQYRCADSGKNWIFVQSVLYTDYGTAANFMPTWGCVIGAPSECNGGIDWAAYPNYAFQDIHIQPDK